MRGVKQQRFLMRIALSATHVFAWVGAFAYFYAQSFSPPAALSAVALTYALTHITTALLTPRAARMLRYGVRRAMTLGACAAACAFFALGTSYLLGAHAIAWGILAFALLMGVYRALYYVPYQYAASRTTSDPFVELGVALVPALAGLLFAYGSHMPATLYIATGMLLIISLLSLLRTPEKHEGFVWGYRETFHQLFDTRHRTLLLSALCEGMEATALLLVWPIAIWLMLDGSYTKLGALLSISLILALMIRTILRRLEIQSSPLVASAVIASAWVLRSMALSPLAIVAIDTYTMSGAGPEQRGVDMLTHEQAADNHSYIDEFSALKEMAHALGRITLCIVMALLAPSNSIAIIFGAVFVIAAVAGAYSIYLARTHARVAF